MADRYYRVGPKFWTDNPHWNDDTRLAGFYFLTCEHRTTEGLFRMPLEYACADLRWPMRKFRPAFDQLIRDGFIEYDHDADVCLIVKALKWQSPTNGNQGRGAVRALEGLPRTPLFIRFVVLSKAFSEHLAKPLCERWPKAFAKAFPEGVTKGVAEAIADPPSPSLTHLTAGSTSDVDEARPPLAVIDGGAAGVDDDLSIGGTR